MSLFPDSWKFAEAREICSQIVDCVNKTAPVVDYETPYKMIRTTNVKNGRIDLSGARCVDEATFIKWNRRLTPRKGDVVLTREAPLGDVGLIRTDDKVFLGQRTMIFRADGTNLDQRFLYYSLLGPTLQAQISALGSGSTVEHVRVPDAEKLIIPHPPIEEQRKIASLLSAYDDLIENNKRRITLLENMAEEIYREWFVRFRFPGWQEAAFEKGLPIGWTSGHISHFLRVLSGGTPKSGKSAFWGDSDDIPFFTPKDAPHGFYVSDTEKHITESGLASCNSLLYGKHTIFITARGTVGKLGIAARDMAMNQSCYALVPKDDRYHLFYFLALKHLMPQVKGVSKSGVFDNIVVDTFDIVDMLVPAEEILDRFQDVVNPIFTQLENLMKSMEILEKTKDQLLPRLISGKLSVENLDIQFPPSMQSDESDNADEAAA